MSNSLHSHIYFDNGIPTGTVPIGGTVQSRIVDFASIDWLEWFILSSSADATASFTLSLQHGDVVDDVDNPAVITDAAPVPANKLEGFDPNPLLFSNNNEIRRVQYQDNKAYVQLVITHNSGGVGELAAAPILSGLPFTPFYREGVEPDMLLDANNDNPVTSNITVDGALSISSTNPVQNTIVTANLNSLQSQVDALAVNEIIEFKPTYYSPIPFINEFTGETHNASGGGAPTQTTAKKGDLVAVEVAGSFDIGNSDTVARGDILHAQVDNPTALTDWAILKDMTSELETAINNADGSTLVIDDGVFLVTSSVNVEVRYHVRARNMHKSILLNRLDEACFDNFGGETFMQNNSTQVDIDTITQEDYTDLINETTDYVSVLNCTTAADAANFKAGDLLDLTTNKSHPYTDAVSKKCFLGEQVAVLDADAATGKIYLSRLLRFQDIFDDLTTGDIIVANTVPLNLAGSMIEGLKFSAAPTFRGNTAGGWHTLYGVVESATVTASSGSERTLTTAVPHNLEVGQPITIEAVNGDTSCDVIVVNSTTEIVIEVPATIDEDTTASNIPTSGSIDYKAAFDRRNGTNQGACITMRYAPFCKVIDCDFDMLWTMGVRLMHCSFARVQDCNFYKLPNALTNSQNLFGRLGYGVLFYGACDQSTWDGGDCTFGRHVFTTGAAEQTSFDVNKSFRYGVPTDWEVMNVISRYGWGVPFDTHEEANGGTFKNCSCYHPFRGSQGGSYTGYGVQVRCANVNVLGYYQEGGSNGIRFASTFQPADNKHIIDAVIRDLDDNGNDSGALRVEDFTGKTNVPNIEGRLIASNCGGGMYLKGGNVRLSEFVHKHVTEKAIFMEGDNTTLHINKCILDHEGKPWQASSTSIGIQMADDSKCFIDDLTVVRGANTSNPRSVFDAADTITKDVGVGKLQVRNTADIAALPLVDTNEEPYFNWTYGGEVIVFFVTPEGSDVTTGTGKVSFELPKDLVVFEVVGSLTTASTTGDVTVDVNDDGTSIFGTNQLTIDANETSSSTATTPANYSSTVLDKGSLFTIDVDAAGTGAQGLKVCVKGYWVG